MLNNKKAGSSSKPGKRLPACSWTGSYLLFSRTRCRYYTAHLQGTPFTQSRTQTVLLKSWGVTTMMLSVVTTANCGKSPGGGGQKGGRNALFDSEGQSRTCIEELVTSRHCRWTLKTND